MISAGSGLDTLLTLAVVGSVVASGTLGFSRHRDLRVVVGMGVGLMFYLFGHALEGQTLGLALSICGALLLASTSFFSARLSQACEHPDHAH